MHEIINFRPKILLFLPVYTQAGDTAKLYFIRGDKIWTSALDGSQPSVLKETPRATGFDFHHAQGKLYWANSNQQVGTPCR